MTGDDLYHWIEKEKELLSEEAVLDIFGQIVDKISVLHKRKVVNGGVVNIAIVLRNSEEMVVVDCDLQTSKMKLGFTPVEVFTEKRVSFAADMFAVGCIIYHVMVHHMPFNASTEVEVVANVCMGKYPLITQGDYSPSLKSLVYKLLDLDAKMRPTADDLKKSELLSRFIRNPSLSSVRVPLCVNEPEYISEEDIDQKRIALEKMNVLKFIEAAVLAGYDRTYYPDQFCQEFWKTLGREPAIDEMITFLLQREKWLENLGQPAVIEEYEEE